jgi:hypothetical protein
MRPTRTDEIQGERKSRKADNLDRMAGMKLGIPPEFQNDKDHYYFWANDVGSRIYDLTTDDDYDVVTSANPEANAQDALRKPVGSDEGGRPIYAQLLRKPVVFMEQHAKARDEAMKEQEHSLSRRPETADGDLQGTGYVTKGSNIKHGGYTP